jgi:hypothetical protein
MLLLWLGTFALAACPQLHERLHKDAQSPAHQCLVTQIQQHQLLTGAVPESAPAPSCVELAEVNPVNLQLSSVSDYRLSPSRAPPAMNLGVAA